MPAYTYANVHAPAAPPLHHLRQVLHPDYALMAHADLVELVDSMYGEGAAERYDEYLEGIFGSIGRAFSSAARDVGNFATKAAPVAATLAGGAVQGALAGARFGPAGIIGGAAIGATGAGLSRYGSGTARDIGGVLSGVTNLAGSLSPLGGIGSSLGGAISGLAGGGGTSRAALAGTAVNALGGLLGSRGGTFGAIGGLLGSGGGAAGALGSLVGGSGGGGSPIGALGSLFGGSSAAGQLMSLLQRPETQRALAALNLGPLGRPSVPGGSGTPIPVSAITNLIGQLSNQAAAEAAALGGDAESVPHYMTDQAGEFVGDPAQASDRAARVWELLNEAQAERVVNAIVRQAREQEDLRQAQEREDWRRSSYFPDQHAESEYYDSLDMADVYGLDNLGETEAWYAGEYAQPGEYSAEDYQ